MRRISTKLVAAVLAAVVLPFVAFALFIDWQMGDRLTRHVVRQALLGQVKELAGQLDYFVYERTQDLEQWADAPLTNRALDDSVAERARGARNATRATEPRPCPCGTPRSSGAPPATARAPRSSSATSTTAGS